MIGLLDIGQRKGIFFVISITLVLVLFSTEAHSYLFQKTSRFAPVQLNTNQILSVGSQCQPKSSHKDFKGEASIVFFHMGDSYATTFFQETVQLNKSFAGYDYKILLYDTTATATSKVMSSRAIKNADEIYQPTRENFFEAIRSAADQGYVVNIYITSHGNQGYYDYIDNVYRSESAYFIAKDDLITEEDIREELGEEECGQMPIRMVYSGACYHAAMNDAWIDVGAKVAAGAPLINFYPTQAGKFATEWKNGSNFNDAINASNTTLSRSIVQSYIYALGFTSMMGKSGCGFWPNVLGKNSCAENYFTYGGPYGMGSDYNSRKSGKGNMNSASKKVISGDKYIDLDTEVSWDL